MVAGEANTGLQLTEVWSLPPFPLQEKHWTAQKPAPVVASTTRTGTASYVAENVSIRKEV